MTLNVADEIINLSATISEDNKENLSSIFRVCILEPLYDSCLAKQQQLFVNFDGEANISRWFLEDVFGGLVRSGFDSSQMLDTMVFISNNNPDLLKEVKNSITNAGRGIKQRNMKLAQQKISYLW